MRVRDSGRELFTRAGSVIGLLLSYSSKLPVKNFDRNVTPAKYCPPVSHYPLKIGSPQIESEFEVCHWSSQESESVNFQSTLGAITAVANDKRIAIFAVVL
jgi:hypothetical protein